MVGELDEALESGAISVVFQPKLRLAEQSIDSGECLVRWESPLLGRISPADFIPELEEKGRIDDLTMFVLREALERRDDAIALGKRLNLTVNVSAQLLADAGFIGKMVDTLEAAATRSMGGLTLEITESAPLVDST
ncbi:MAG: EAL domain-containing protein, partial [Pseudomonadota bacterium]